MSPIKIGMLVIGAAAVILDLFLPGTLPPTAIFVMAAIGLIPLAGLIGEGTEELAHYTGPRLGGLLNATLGNAAELIITIFAINAGLLDLVKASITGSIIGNLLLVLGFSLLAGGIKNGTQFFDRRTAGLNAVLMILAVFVLVIPSLFDPALIQNPSTELFFNEGVAFIIIVLYALSLVYSFTAKTPKESSQGGDDPHPHMQEKVDTSREPAEVHPVKWTMRTSLIVLALATVGTAFVSETLIGAVEPVVASLGITEFFLGLIIIPLVGNVAEHLVAVQVAMKNKMELSMAVALGSSLQIALFVAPVLVFISLLFGQRLLLVFTSYELLALVVSAFIATFIALDGESNWFEGAMLLAVYLIFALAFFFLPGASAAVH
jgi:Ca2+:H+ antiporter